MGAESPNIFITVFAFIMLIGSLVVVHELGHYLVGRWFGVKADKFSIGFGPEIFARVDKRGTRWRIGALPLGGYVQFAGDMNPASQPGAGRGDMSDAEYAQTFQSKTLWQRALIVFAGPAVNFILAILIFMGFLLSFGQSSVEPVISELSKGGAAIEAGLEVGDRIVEINGREVASFRDLQNEIFLIPNETVKLTIERSGRSLEKELTVKEEILVDRFGNKSKIGLIGVIAKNVKNSEVSLLESPLLALKETYETLRLQIAGLGQIISGKRSVKELGGPLKIGKIAGEQFSLGWPQFFSLAALISINLGFMNLLPIPMLDGGHLFLYAIEAVRKRPASPMVQEWAFRVGFAMVVGFMLMVTFNDLESFGLFG